MRQSYELQVANSAVYEADGLIRALRGMTHR